MGMDGQAAEGLRVVPMTGEDGVVRAAGGFVRRLLQLITKLFDVHGAARVHEVVGGLVAGGGFVELAKGALAVGGERPLTDPFLDIEVRKMVFNGGDDVMGPCVISSGVGISDAGTAFRVFGKGSVEGSDDATGVGKSALLAASHSQSLKRWAAKCCGVSGEDVAIEVQGAEAHSARTAV